MGELEYFRRLFSVAAVSAGAVITRTSWPAVTMRGPLFCGMDSQARGPKSTRCDAWNFLVIILAQFHEYVCRDSFLRFPLVYLRNMKKGVGV